jgi:predicted ATPase
MGHAEPALRGRQREAGLLEALVLSADAGRASSLLMLGDAGMGKTRMLAHAVASANEIAGGDRGPIVLRCLGSEVETDLPFAALHQLLRPVLHHLDSLARFHAEPLRGALGLGPPKPGGRFGVAAATLELLAVTAGSGLLVVIVDDAHWVDRSSLEVLGFVGRRPAQRDRERGAPGFGRTGCS